MSAPRLEEMGPAAAETLLDALQRTIDADIELPLGPDGKACPLRAAHKLGQLSVVARLRMLLLRFDRAKQEQEASGG
jgi:hypothetical protein